VKLSTAVPAFQPILRKIAEDPQSLSAYSSELQEKLKLKPNSTIALPLGGTLCLSSSLPHNLDLKGLDGSKVDFESLKIISQNFILPTLSETMPGTEPYVTGAQVLWISADIYKEIIEDEIDVTKVTIKVVELASKVTGILLTHQGAPNAALVLNTVAALCIATADKLYVARLSEK
jgi:hypothetical protein